MKPQTLAQFSQDVCPCMGDPVPGYPRLARLRTVDFCRAQVALQVGSPAGCGGRTPAPGNMQAFPSVSGPQSHWISLPSPWELRTTHETDTEVGSRQARRSLVGDELVGVALM